MAINTLITTSAEWAEMAAKDEAVRERRLATAVQFEKEGHLDLAEIELELAIMRDNWAREIRRQL